MINDRISDDRLEVLLDAYKHLASDPYASRALKSRDLEHVSIINELLMCRQAYCPDCRGLGYVENPDAQWSADENGIGYCNGPEEIDCPTCFAVGFVRPDRPGLSTVYVEAVRDDGLPF